MKSDKSETQCKQAEKAERRRVEEALNKSEEKYRELANCISDPFFALNKDMRFTYWNRASETNTGILADSIIGKYLFDVFPELKGTQIERAYNEAIATCKVQFLENNRWEQQGGAVTYHDVSIYPTADGIAVFSRDVTERKRAEEALYESEKKFIKIFQGNAAAIALTRLRDGCIIEVNEKWQEVFGFSREEVIGKSTMDEIKVWKNPEERTLAIRDLEMHGAFRNRECDFIRKSGEAWTALMSSEVIQLLGEAFILSSLVDITERKRAEEALRKAHDELELRVQERTTDLQETNKALQKSEEQFRISVENMLDAFGIYSAIREPSGRIIDFKVEYVNKVACEANLMTKREQIGKRLLELLPAHWESGLFDEYCRVVETGKPLIKESLVYEDFFGGGRRVHKAVDIQVMKLGDGFVASWRDVTERKHAEEKIREQATLLDNAQEAIGVRSLEHSLIYWNKGAERLYGWTAGEVIGKNADRLVYKEEPPQVVTNS